MYNKHVVQSTVNVMNTIVHIIKCTLYNVQGTQYEPVLVFIANCTVQSMYFFSLYTNVSIAICTQLYTVHCTVKTIC